jgi:hypothetical protein
MISLDSLIRWKALTVSVIVGLSLALALVWGLTSAHAQVADSCFAEYTGDNVTDFASGDASAVRAAIAAAAPNGVVKIAGTCAGVVTENGTTQVALITQTLTLRGGYTDTNWTVSNPAANPTTLDAQGGGRVLYVSAAATLEGFTVTNGSISGDGAGIYAADALTLNTMTVYSNTATGSGAGAYIGGAATLTESVFQQNTGLGNQSGGGAFFNSTATLTGNTFSGNAAQYGGGIGVIGAATLTANTFLNNTAQVNGGGAEFNSGAALTNNTFTGNAAQFGGGLNIFGAAELTANTFISNTALAGGGGAALVSTTTLTNNTFSGNTAQYGGGAVAFGAATFTGNTFISNTAQFNGGGAEFSSGAALTNNTFSLNTAQFGGGANFFGTATLASNTFISNTAQISGGGAALNNAATLTGNTFTSNTAQFGGGARLVYTATLASDIFNGNTAQFGGGALIGGTAELTSTTFTDNTATGGGGGAVFQGTAAVQQSVFQNNQADDGAGIGTGGGIQLDAASAQVTLSQTQFTGNRAQGYNDDGGGAIMIYAGSLTVTRSSLVSNSTPARGGAVSVFADGAGQVSIENSLLAGNSASLGGQAVSLRVDKPLSLVHTTIASPTVVSGPAIEVLTGTVSITNTVVASHTVGIENVGGAVAEDYTLFDTVATPYSGTLSAGANSITGTAAFVSPNTGNYHLGAGSAAVDAGADVGVTTDYDGDARPQGGGVDIGFDELPVAVMLTVNVSGTGNGSVTSTPGGVNCGSDCSEAYSYGTVVTLTASAATGSTFTGWSGACAGTGNCLVMMDAAKNVTATFTQQGVSPQYQLYLPLIRR